MHTHYDYKDYAFIDDPPITESEAKPELGALTLLNHNMETIISRSYENSTWYYVVFKPFNKTYTKMLDWYTIKGLDSCRKYFKKPEVYILTREIDAEKIHINALVCTRTPPVDGSVYNNKYKLHVSELSTLGDRMRVLTYVTKEFYNRSFYQYLDYLYNPKVSKLSLIHI